MSSIGKRLTFGVIALIFVVCSTVAANAQYVVSYYQPYTSYYAPATTAYSSYYAPTSYQTYYSNTAAYQTYYASASTPVVYTSGWYPGYWLNRTRNALFGQSTVVAAPSTYVASYPSTYTASYPTTYSASYAPTYTASYPSSYVASYAASAPACSSCATQQVTLRPVCETPCSSGCATGCSSCGSCSSCGVTAVTPTSYVQASPACANCSTGVSASASPSPTPAADTSTFGSQQPGLGVNEQVPGSRSSNRPESSSSGEATGGSGSSTNGTGVNNSTNGSDDPLQRLLDEDNDSSSFFQAPALFDPSDKTVQYSPAPVHMAVYKRPAGETPDHPVDVRPISISAEKAKLDAAGWTSASR